MKYVIDNDLHIHSKLSLCSDDPEQTPERILRYAKDNGIRTICVTDHYWEDEVAGASDWYKMQGFNHICQTSELTGCEDVRFLFGCETDINKENVVGISKDGFKHFDFVIIPTTHLHMKGFTISDEDAQNIEKRAEIWVRKLDAVLNMDIPFYKVGIAHPVCKLIVPERKDYISVLKMIDENEMVRLFKKVAKLGCGIEINASDMDFSDEEKPFVLKPFRIAKECGCKFYLGSDAHHPAELDSAIKYFEKAIDLLELTEDDKFRIV